MSTTLQQLIDGAKALADMENEGDDAFVSATLWKSWINQGCKELQRIEVSSDPDSFFATVDFTMDGSSNIYTLPSDFLAVRGLTLNPGQSNRQTIHKFQFGERDRASSVTDMFGGYLPSRRYRVISRTQLLIEPKESSAGTYRLYYIPEPATLASEVTRTFDIETDDTAPPSGDPDYIAWGLQNAALTSDDIGQTLTLDFDAPNDVFNGDCVIVGTPSSTLVYVTPVVSQAGFTNPAAGTATVHGQPANTSNELDVSLDRFAEYIMIVAAIKAVAKEEGDISELVERRNLMRQDIAENVNMDANEPNTIVDTSDGWFNQ